MKKKTSRIAMPDLQPQRGFPAAYREILFSFRKNTFGGIWKMRTFASEKETNMYNPGL
jgi:hypothetical protein